MIFAPVMSKDVKFSRAKINQTKIVEQNLKLIVDRPPLNENPAVEKVFSSEESQQTKDVNPRLQETYL